MKRLNAVPFRPDPNFLWTITSDGKDYENGENGCGQLDASDKKENKSLVIKSKKGDKCALRTNNRKHYFSKDIKKTKLKIGG